MVQIAGTYKHEKDENLETYFSTIGLPQEVQKLAMVPGLTVDVTEEDNKYTFKTSSKLETTLKVGEEVDENAFGLSVKSTLKREDNNLIVNSVMPGGRTSTRIYAFTNEGFVVVW